METEYKMKTCRECRGYDEGRTDELLLIGAISCKTRSTVVPETFAEECQFFKPIILEKISRGGQR